VGNESKNQKEYVDLVYKEAGENVFFLGAVSQEDLSELYKVAKVHALVSWMETPGLSSLEAAVMDCNIVVTKKGDTEEYFQDLAYYCEPDDVESIKNAIELAYTNPINPELKSKVLTNYIWEKTAEETLKAYQ
jgi:glycosyltransferase involved in cell wall biosynthesis